MFLKIKEKMQEIANLGETKDLIKVGKNHWVNKAFVVNKDGEHVFQSHVQQRIKQKSLDSYFEARKPIVTKGDIMEAKIALGLM